MTAITNTAHRFANIATAPPDSILGLTETYNADPNPEKMNLAVGVYKDSAGKTPVLRCVKAAEQRLVDHEPTKGYLPIDGIANYRDHVRQLVFGNPVDSARLAILQTPGGTGALRLAAGFLATQLAPVRIWISNPTWANHESVFAAEGLPIATYRYLADDRKSLDFEGMLSDLRTQTKPGDAILLHACCHNPTGIDLSIEQWREIAAVVAERGILPLLDFAYQGFGNGLEQDQQGIAAIIDACDEAIVCSSFSKNFGLYSERVGALSLLAANPSEASASQSQLKALVRSNYSNPPQHGAAIIATILGDAKLTEMWKSELDEMRGRIKALRQQFVETMQTTGAGHDFSFLLDQHGMFSFSGLNKMQVDRLKSEHSIYIVGSGRINVAGMTESRMGVLCTAIAGVIES